MWWKNIYLWHLIPYFLLSITIDNSSLNSILWRLVDLILPMGGRLALSRQPEHTRGEDVALFLSRNFFNFFLSILRLLLISCTSFPTLVQTSSKRSPFPIILSLFCSVCGLRCAARPSGLPTCQKPLSINHVTNDVISSEVEKLTIIIFIIEHCWHRQSCGYDGETNN